MFSVLGPIEDDFALSITELGWARSEERGNESSAPPRPCRPCTLWFCNNAGKKIMKHQADDALHDDLPCPQAASRDKGMDKVWTETGRIIHPSIQWIAGSGDTLFALA